MSFFGHTDSVSCGVFSPDGKYLITASEDTCVKVWELKSQTLLHTIKGKKFHQAPISSIAISKTKNVIATGSFENELAISNFENANVNIIYNH
jgi:ribosome assembly protein SQT1